MTDINGLPNKSSPDDTDNLVIQQADGQGFKLSIANLLAEGRSAIANLAAAFNGYIPLDEKGAADGVATLGSDGKVPATQLPALSGGGDSGQNTTTTNYTIATPGDGLGIIAQRQGEIGVAASGIYNQNSYSLEAPLYHRISLENSSSGAGQFSSLNEITSWWRCRFPGKLIPNRCWIRSKSNSNSEQLRNYKIQFSNNAIDWIDAFTAVNDVTLNNVNTYKDIQITGITEGYRYARILQTGVNSSNSNFLIFSRIDFGGTLIEV